MNRPPTDLYDSDFVQWAERHADLLRQGRIDKADLPHIIEAIEDLAETGIAPWIA